MLANTVPLHVKFGDNVNPVAKVFDAWLLVPNLQRRAIGVVGEVENILHLEFGEAFHAESFEFFDEGSIVVEVVLNCCPARRVTFENEEENREGFFYNFFNGWIINNTVD